LRAFWRRGGALIGALLGGGLTLLTAASQAAPLAREVGPGQTFATIQAGIEAAVAGDTVRVHPGTYVEALTITGKWLRWWTSGTAARSIVLRV
jgi:pectin methylesterase-like acyl-CoA thioesterase